MLTRESSMGRNGIRQCKLRDFLLEEDGTLDEIRVDLGISSASGGI